MGYQLPDQSGQQAPTVEGITDTTQGGTDETPIPASGQYVPEITGPVNTLNGTAIPNILHL